MNDAIRLIRDYLEAVHGGSEGLHRARLLLADDLEITSIRSIYDPRPFLEMGG